MTKTITITNPKCQKCSNRLSCTNKTFMFALIDENICKDYQAELAEKSSEPIQMIPEVIQNEIANQLLNKELNISVGIDYGIGNSKQVEELRLDNG